MIELTASDGTKLVFHDLECAYQWVSEQEEELLTIRKALELYQENKANLEEFKKKVFTPNGDGEYMRIWKCPSCGWEEERDKKSHSVEIGLASSNMQAFCEVCLPEKEHKLIFTGEKRWKEYPKEKEPKPVLTGAMLF